MNKFEICDNVLYSIDLRKISIIDKRTNDIILLDYPEAIVLLILIEGNKQVISYRMLEAILDMGENDTKKYVNKCINNWKSKSLIK
jgi:hypothetical protein